ncbi:MAG: RND family transporter, partial [Rhodocyclaceae bacterium]|nr:RND family transporter [Rhodocyclaceae bacterium]
MKMNGANAVVRTIGKLLFSWRRSFLALFVLITLGLIWSATHLRVDAGFEKMIPLKHEYMRTFTAYQKTFGGANRVLVALRQQDGDIYNPEFFRTLKAVTDAVF